jgi:putative heme iron utilization protein
VSDNPFGPDVVTAVAKHMNEDHAADSLMIVRALGDTPDATAAELFHIDGTGVDFKVAVGDEERAVRVPFSRPLTERPAIREELTRMSTEAATALGVEPRTEG